MPGHTTLQSLHTHVPDLCTPKGSESHFKVVIVSAQFEGQALLSRHRAVNALLSEELEGPVHALSIKAKTPKQWDQTGGLVDASPQCLGGSKR